MECLLPDRRVGISSVPHGRDPPLRTPLRGHGDVDYIFTTNNQLKISKAS